MLNKAIAFAAKAHEGAKRKGTEIPYIFHPLEAMQIVYEMTGNEKLASAAVLHDTLEDTKAKFSDIENEFGPEIASLVASETEDKSKTWKERKQYTLDFLNYKATKDEKIVALGDKLSNMRAIAKDYEKIGEALWTRFREQDKSMQGWYYLGLRDALKELEDYKAWHEYVDLVKKVFDQKGPVF